jgi:hypothetical protein
MIDEGVYGMSKHREQFEAWLETSGLSFSEGIGAWYGWLAALENLSKTIDYDECFSPHDCDEWAIWLDVLERKLDVRTEQMELEG